MGRQGEVMARYQLTQHGWSVGQYLIPTGTILDSADWKWNGIALPWPPPVSAAVMDQEAFDEMLKFYPAHSILIAGDINGG
jgi:hypothetical protein